MFGLSSAYCKGLNTQSKQQRAQRTALWNTPVWMEGVTSVSSGEEMGHELKLLPKFSQMPRDHQELQSLTCVVCCIQ